MFTEKWYGKNIRNVVYKARFEKLVREFDSSKNNGLNLTDFDADSEEMVWWKCENRPYHVWQDTIKNRVLNRTNCPICSGRLPTIGKDDFKTIGANLLRYWDYDKNGMLHPEDVFAYGDRQIWFKCENGHSWQMTARTAIIRKNDNLCPYCSGNKILTGFNDLETLYPEIADEWHPTKNGTLKPNMVMPNSKQKVWWKCSHGHEWETAIYLRTKRGYNCPECYRGLHTSFYEQAVLYYIHSIDKTVIGNYYTEMFQWDVYIQSRKILIEYDGAYYHKDRIVQDNIKNKYAYENGYTLYRIIDVAELDTEEATAVYKNPNTYLRIDNNFYYLNNKETVLNDIIKALIKEIYNTEIDVNVRRDRTKIKETYLISYTDNITSKLEDVRNNPDKYKDSFGMKYPELAKEWDNERNGLTAYDVTYGNEKQTFWWICSKNPEHKFQAKIYDRVTTGQGCPVCDPKSRRVLTGFNDALTLHPEFAKYAYDPLNEKEGLYLNKCRGDSKRINFWWKCPQCGRIFRKSLFHMAKYDKCSSCGYEFHEKTVKVRTGSVSLQDKNPELASEWDFELNDKKYNPSTISSRSGYKAWWICPKCGNSYQATVAHRAEGKGCPYCAGKKVKIGFNDLATTNPEIADAWNYELNDFKPTDITNGTSKDAWLNCSDCGKPFLARIRRIKDANGIYCPSCALRNAKKRKTN